MEIVLVICTILGGVAALWNFRDKLFGKKDKKKATNETSDHKKFPPVEWLSGKDVMQKYNLSGFELYQHIENGLPVYPEDTDTMYKDPKPMEKEEMWFGMATEKAGFLEHDLSNCLFKRTDIEKILIN